MSVNDILVIYPAEVVKLDTCDTKVFTGEPQEIIIESPDVTLGVLVDEFK